MTDRQKPLRVLWAHNADPSRLSRGVFIRIAADAVRRHGIDLHLEYLGMLRSPAGLLQARRRLQRMAPEFDVVHAQYGSACAMVTAAVEGVPKVVSVRGNDWAVHDETIGFLFAHTRLASLMTRLTLDRFDCVVPVSRRLSAEVQRWCPGAWVRTIASPVDLGQFRPRDRAEARALLGHGGCTDKWVLFTALDPADPIKRADLAAAVCAEAHRRRGDVQLKVATGMRHDQLPVLVAACDAILCTSESEGWPNSVKEALACNVPFVATDVSDLSDIAAQEPDCHVCPAEVEPLADALCATLARPRSARLRRYVEPMSTEAVAGQLVDVYEQLAVRANADRVLA